MSIPNASNIPDIDVTTETSTFLPITPLEAPVLTTPDEQHIFEVAVFDVVPTITFTWAAVAGATDYEIEVADKSDFDSILKVVKVTGGALTVNYVPIITDPITHALTGGDIQFLTDAQYYWRVRATAGVVSSPWSKIWEFGFHRQTIEEATAGNQFFQEGVFDPLSSPPIAPLPTAAEMAAAEAAGKSYPKLEYDGTVKSVKAVLTPALDYRYPTIPQVAGDLPAAANGDLWFDTAVSSVPGPGEVISMVWNAGMGAYLVTYQP